MKRSCHICESTVGLYDCDSCGRPACKEHTSATVAYGMDWRGCDRCCGRDEQEEPPR